MKSTTHEWGQPSSWMFLLAATAATATAACGTGAQPPSAVLSARYSLSYTTPPGQETHWCQYVRLPRSDAGEVLLTGYQWTWSGLHHWSLYRTVGELPTDLDVDHPFDCFAPGGMDHAAATSLLIVGDPSGESTFPPDTGFALHSEEVVMVQAHTINPTTIVQNPTLDVRLDFANPREVTTRLGLMQFYDPYIVVPAHTDVVAQMRCRMPHDFTILRATTHQHIRGTGVRVFLDGPEGQAGTEPVVESRDWQHPTVLDSELRVGAGSYLRTVCQYRGDDHEVVVQGQDKLDNEMCMFIGFYHPAVAPEDGGEAFENCIQTPLPGGVGDAFGAGTQSCAEALSCVRACPPADAPRPSNGRVDVGACWQTCIVDSCPAASAPLDALLYCVRQQCAAECSRTEACTSCVAAKCSGQYAACQAQSC